MLDTATDGVLMLDRTGRVLSANRSAEALFGYDAADFAETQFGDLFAADSVEKVGVSTGCNFCCATGAFLESGCGGPHHLRPSQRSDF